MSRASLSDVVASNIRRLRLHRRWSQEDFAARCGLHRTYIGAIERGERNITINTLARIARALGTAPGALLQPLGDRRS